MPTFTEPLLTQMRPLWLIYDGVCKGVDVAEALERLRAVLADVLVAATMGSSVCTQSLLSLLGSSKNKKCDNLSSEAQEMQNVVWSMASMPVPCRSG